MNSFTLKLVYAKANIRISIGKKVGVCVWLYVLHHLISAEFSIKKGTILQSKSPLKFCDSSKEHKANGYFHKFANDFMYFIFFLQLKQNLYLFVRIRNKMNHLGRCHWTWLDAKPRTRGIRDFLQTWLHSNDLFIMTISMSSLLLSNKFMAICHYVLKLEGEKKA